MPVIVPEPEANGITTAAVPICSDDTPTERPVPCGRPDTCSLPDATDAIQCDIVSAERVKGLSRRSVKPCGKRNCTCFRKCVRPESGTA